MKTLKSLNIKLILIVILIILSLLSISIGIENFNLINLFKGESQELHIFLNSRLPRLLSIIIAGVSLSVAGLIMQTISANKFVSPSTAGTMDFAKLGLLFAFFFAANNSTLVKISLAFIVSLIGTLIFMVILRKTKFKNSAVVPLLGIMLGNVVSSISTFIAYRYDLVQNMTSWLMGSFSLITKGNYELLYLGIPFIIIAYFYASKFTIASMGEDFSTSLGLNHKLIVSIGLIIVSIITALVVVTIGTIPFVGLIVPNIVSLYRGDNIKRTLFETALFGSILVLFADIISRVIIFPYEVSISVVMSVIGSIIFLIIIFRRKTRIS